MTIAKLAIEQLTKSRGRMFAAITVMALGIAIMTSISMIIDTMEAGFVAQEEYLYGNIKYTAYNPVANYAEQPQHTIPANLTSSIRSLQGVTAVAARKGRPFGFCSGENTIDFHTEQLFGIDVSNPDEKQLGRGIVIDCLPAIAMPNKATLEDLLSTTIVPNPCVISDAISRDFGWNVGDTIKPSSENFTRAYATSEELAMVANGTISASELESTIQSDRTRWMSFNIVGIFLDGSEAIEKPTPHKAHSLNTITPKSRTAYFRLNDTLSIILNADPDGVAYFIISGEIGTTAIAPYAVFNIRESVQDFIDYSMLVARSLLLVLSMFSLLVCAYMIKAVIEFNIEERKKEIGIMLAIGFDRNSVTRYVTTQILAISAIATTIGFCIGLVLPLNIDTRAMIQFLSYNKVYEVSVEMPIAFKPESIALVIGFGLAFPLLQGLAPLKELKQWNIIEMMNPEHVTQTTILSKKITEPGMKGRRNPSTKSREKQRNKHLKKIASINSMQMKAKRAMVPVVLMALGLFGVFYACLNMYPEQSYSRLNFTESWVYLVILGVSGGIFVIALLRFSRELIASLTALFTRNRISRKYLKEMNDYVPKRVYQSSMQRNQSNLTTALIITTALVVSFLTVYGSFMTGDAKTNRSKLGGDVVIFDPLISDTELVDLRSSVTGIGQATLVNYLLMSGWRYNSVTEGLLINAVDGIGGKGANRSESMNIVCIDPSSFVAVNPDADVLYDITRPNCFLSGSDFVLRLNQPGTIIMQTKLLDQIGKSIGDSIELNVMGLAASLQITGACDFMPCAPQMAFLDSAEGITRTAIISRQTLSSIVASHFGSTDIMVKNMTLDIAKMTNETVSDDYLGYLSGRLDVVSINASIMAVSGARGASFRFSTFAPSIPELTMAYTPSRMIYTHPNATFSTNISLQSRFYAFDPLQECRINIGTLQERVLGTHPFIQFPLSNTYDGDIRVYNRTAAEQLYAFEHVIDGNPYQRQSEQNIFNRTLACIVNKYVANYEHATNLTFVHENKVGDIITAKFEGTGEIIDQNFTVIGIVDNHYAYLHQSGTEQEPFRLSQRTINFDSRENTTSASFTDIFDSEANVFFTTISEMAYLEFLAARSPFGQASGGLINHAYVRVNDGQDPTAVARQLNQQFVTRGLVNVTAVAVKELFLNKTSRLGSLSIKLASGANETSVIQDLRGWYIARGYTWRESAVGTLQRMSIESDIMVAEPLFNLLYTFAFVSAIVANFSLCLIVFMYIRGRYKEIGVLKSMGFSSESIQRSIFTESFISNVTGQLLGAGCGMGLIYLILSTISSTLVIPFIFSVPITELVVVMAITLGISLAAAFFNSRQMMRLPIAEILRYE